MVLVIALLTQLIYPYLYGFLISLNAVMLIVVTARNLLVIALFAWAVIALLQLSRTHQEFAETDDTERSAAWPLGSA
jgi:hypothetical protein